MKSFWLGSDPGQKKLKKNFKNPLDKYSRMCYNNARKRKGEDQKCYL